MDKSSDGHCPKCGEYDPDMVATTYGVCMVCADKMVPLIKVENHYVPRSYRYWIETNDSKEDQPDDRCAQFPEITWYNKRRKYKVMFTGADSIGEAETFEWYFDKKEDMLKAMGFYVAGNQRADAEIEEMKKASY